MIAQRCATGRHSTFLVVVALVGALLGAPPGGALAQETSAGSDPRAVGLVEAWINALGGMEHLRSLVSARFTLTTEMYDASTGRLRRTRPRYVTIDRQPSVLAARIERWEGDDFIVQGWDGRTNWAFMNGQRLTPGDRDQQEVRYVSGEVNYWVRLPQKLMDPGVLLHYDGEDVSGRHTVRVTFGEDVGDQQDTYFYYFVDGRVWPVQVDYQEEGSDHVEHTRWEDIRSVDGYHYVGARVHFDDEGRVFKIIRVGDAEVNPVLPPQVFSEPGTPGG